MAQDLIITHSDSTSFGCFEFSLNIIEFFGLLPS